MASEHKARISSRYILKCFVDISSIHVLRRLGFDGPARRFSVQGSGEDIFRCYVDPSREQDRLHSTTVLGPKGAVA